MSERWSYYHEMRPDELAERMVRAPVAFWPLGLLEHHGWHLPIGFDGIKAEHLCIRIAEQTGGVMLPVLWWGGLGGHGDFLWTHYQHPDAAGTIVETTVRQLLDFGFQAVLLLAGHSPWQSILDARLPGIRNEHPDRLILWGTEGMIAATDVRIAIDHAALEETSCGLALFPERVKMEALRPGRAGNPWPAHGGPPEGQRLSGLSYDPADPLFAQYGKDARDASAGRVADGLDAFASHLARQILDHLGTRQ